MKTFSTLLLVMLMAVFFLAACNTPLPPATVIPTFTSVPMPTQAGQPPRLRPPFCLSYLPPQPRAFCLEQQSRLTG
jgi:hypothetical protein